MTADESVQAPGSTPPAAVQITTGWAVLFTARSNGYKSLQERSDGPSARREAERPTGVAPPDSWDGEVVSQTIMTSPWQLTPGEPPIAAQLAGLAEAALGRLRQLASSDPLSAEA